MSDVLQTRMSVQNESSGAGERSSPDCPSLSFWAGAITGSSSKRCCYLRFDLSAFFSSCVSHCDILHSGEKQEALTFLCTVTYNLP